MKVVVVLRLSQVANKVSAFARCVVSCMTDNPLFPSPNPSLDRIRAGIADLAAGNAAVLTRGMGRRAARDVELSVLSKDLTRLSHYVQDVADADPPNAESIVASAGMYVKRPSIRNKAPLKAVRGSVSGSVKLFAKSAGDRKANHWRYSTDQKTWIDVPPTLQANTVLYGLEPVTTYYFQHRVMTKDGTGNWGDVVSLVVE